MKLYINGKIASLDKFNSIYEAVAVEDGRIVALGSTEEISCLNIRGNAEIVDLEGKLVLPAFNDSHMHLIEYANTLTRVNLTGAKSILDIIRLVKNFIENNNISEGSLVEGFGWNQDYFIDEKRFPTRYDLDKISVSHPIILTRACVHALTVNTKALEMAGINATTPQVEGGIFEIENDECNGIFREKARQLLQTIFPKVSKELIKKNILLAQPYLLAQGIMSVQTDDFGFADHYEDVIQAYKELDREGKLKIRVYEQCNFRTIEDFRDFLKKGYHKEKGSEHFRLGPLKILGDGSLGARTALLRKPYVDAPETKGIAIFEKEKLLEYMELAHNHGMQIAVHAIGDGMIDEVLGNYHKILAKHPRDNHRHGIVHCQITDQTLLERFQAQQILAYIQPIFLHYDMHMVEQRVGAELAATSYNWKTLYDLGVITAMGSDSPVESFHSMNNIYCAVTRKDLTGYPDGGYQPEQCLTVEETLRSFTNYGAYASFEEHIKGSLEIGKYADMIVLSEDIFTAEPESIRNIGCQAL